MENLNQTNNQMPDIMDILKNGEEEVSSNNSGLVISDAEFDKISNEKKNEYNGKGIVIDKADIKDPTENAIKGNVTPEMKDSVNDYITDQDKQIAEAKAVAEKMKEKGITPEMLKAKKAGVSPHNINREALKNAQKPTEIVNIYLDGTDIGKVQLSDEIMKKVEIADAVRLVKQHDLTGIKIDRTSENTKETKMHIMEKAFDRTLSPFIALGSGYMGKMGNCSTSDFIKLGRAIDAGANYQSQLDRWQLLYEKMRYCSIGKFETFDDFLKGTAYDDYENLQFALICASLPEDTTLSFTCPNCNQQFTFTVKNKDLLRTELISEEMKDYVADIVEADTFIERAREVYRKSPFNQITRIAVNDNDDYTVLMDLYAPSAYDVIERVFKGIPQEYHDNPEYAPYIALINLVKAIYIAKDDVDENGEYIYEPFEDPVEILETLTRFNQFQLDKITNYINETYLSHKYYYGIQNVVCPNPSCKRELGEYAMGMDQLLFLKLHRQ